jgi:hypothetical protein
MKFNLLTIWIGHVFLFSFSIYAQPNIEGLYRITPWAQNKKAAACITFDDNCPGQFDFALPALNQRNLKATFFIITGGSQCGNVSWPRVDSAFSAGHEIGSHSVTHPNMANSDSLTIENELGNSYQNLRQRYYPEGWKMTIAYPFGRGGGSSVQDKRIRRLAQKYYFGGRSAGIGPTGFTGYNDFTNPFYNAFYMQIGTYVMGPGNLPTAAQLSVILDSTEKKGGIFTGLYHGIENGGFNNLPITTFNEHLDSMIARQSKVWITPFGNAVKYHTQRRAEPKLEFVGSVFSSQNVFSVTYKLTDTLSGPWYNEPLTFRIIKSLVADLSNVDSVTGGAKNVIMEDDSLQFDLRPGDSVSFHLTYTSIKKLETTIDEFSIFPNPSTGDFSVLFTGKEHLSQKVDLKIIDLNGRTIETQKNLRWNKNTLLVNLKSNFALGSYWIEISDDYRTFRKLWIKE